MFTSREKPLPAAVFKANQRIDKSQAIAGEGVHVGTGCYWHPLKASNPHAAIVGTSGSGKTQTLKALMFELVKTPGYRVLALDVHGDLDIPGERLIPLHMSSTYGVNPLAISQDPEGGGPGIQSIVVAESLKRSLQMGPNQVGYIIQLIKDCYLERGLMQTNITTWSNEPPDFSDLEEKLTQLAEDGDKEANRILLKLSATFQFGIFSRPQPDWVEEPLTRVDLSKLPSELASIAIESLTQQLFNRYRLAGEGNSPMTFIVIDECKLMYKSRSLDRILTEGRKFSIGALVASQSERHMSQDLLGNAAFKLVLPVDQMEVKKVAQRFRFDEKRIAALNPLQALVRVGKDAYMTNVIPFWQRV